MTQPPANLIEPMCIKVWEEGRNASYTQRAKMQEMFNVTSRDVGTFFEKWDIILTPTISRPTPRSER